MALNGFGRVELPGGEGEVWQCQLCLAFLIRGPKLGVLSSTTK